MALLPEKEIWKGCWAGQTIEFTWMGKLERRKINKSEIDSCLLKLQLMSGPKESSTVIYYEILSNGKLGHLNLDYSVIAYTLK